MLGDLEHLHAQNVKTLLFELLDDVADGFLADRVRLNNGESAFKCFHFVVGRYSSEN
jgi:hypothetical protein